MKSPLVSAAAKGFGIPGLATDAVTFVDGVLNTIGQQSGLVTIWRTGSLEFAVSSDTSARFSMKPGLWVTVDSDYAQQSHYLEGHLKKGFKRAVKLAGLQKHIRFHDLRHTFATRLVQAGVDIITVQHLLGHAKITMTARYAHSPDPSRIAAVKQLDRLLQTDSVWSPAQKSEAGISAANPAESVI